MNDHDEDIAAWYAGQSLPPESLARLEAMAEPSRRGRPWIRTLGVSLALAAAVGFVVGAWAVWPSPDPTVETQPILYAALEPAPAPAPFVVPEGFVRTTVTLSDNSALSGFLSPGTAVDVLSTADGRTKTLYQAMFVLEISADERTVDLLTTPEQRDRLREAQAKGKITLTLRNDLDVNLSPLPDRATLRSRLESAQGVAGIALKRSALLVSAPEIAPPAAKHPTGEGERMDRFSHATRTAYDPVSTFSMDVDTASFSFARAQLGRHVWPDPSAIRVEEFVNALPYDYPRPTQGLFSASFEAVPSPWTRDYTLVRIGIRARDIPDDQRGPVHLTFLVDTSGSMQGQLPLVQQSLGLLTRSLGPEDTVALVQFDAQARVVLPPTAATDPAVDAALSSLQIGGGTDLHSGLLAAYPLAGQQLSLPGTHRLVLCTDGMPNIGETDGAALSQEINGWSRRGIGLTALGFGRDGYRDALMESFADRSDGNYAYIDTFEQARTVLSDNLMETMLVVARDAKVAVTWDEDIVESWRLIGYDDRALADRDFRDDTVDAAEIGPGHRVTALYEVKLAHAPTGEPLGTLELRAEPPGAEGQPAVTQRLAIPDAVKPSLEETSRETRMAIAAASLALHLAYNPIVQMGAEHIAALAEGALRDEYPADRELLSMILETRTAKPREERRCREFQMIKGGRKEIILVDDQGVPCAAAP